MGDLPGRRGVLLCADAIPSLVPASEVASAIAYLQPGAHVRQRLSNGREVSGRLLEKGDGTLRVEDVGDVEVAQVLAVFLDFKGLEGPE